MAGVSFYNLLAGVSVGIFMTPGPADCNGAGSVTQAVLSLAPAFCIPPVHVSVAASWPSCSGGPYPSALPPQQRWPFAAEAVSENPGGASEGWCLCLRGRCLGLWEEVGMGASSWASALVPEMGIASPAAVPAALSSHQLLRCFRGERKR